MADFQFQFKKGQLLFWRLGGINSVKQKHWGKTVDRYGETILLHQPPVKRGLWAFPYPFYDYFFAYGQWTRRMPKKFQNEGKPDFDKMTDEEAKAYWEEEKKCMEKIQHDFPPTTFWYGGGFYSHIGPHKAQVDYNNWFWWDNPKEWAIRAKKEIFVVDNYGTTGDTTKGNTKTLYFGTYSKDHLEIFIPNF